jgi:hypothetical protein
LFPALQRVALEIGLQTMNANRPRVAKP